MSDTDWTHLPELEWKQPGALSRSYELRDGERVVGSLEFPSAFGSRATGTAGSSVWTLKRTGFLSPKVTMRVAGSEADTAVYEPSFGGSRGTVHLAGGEQVRLRSTNFWNTEWTLFDAGEQPLLRFHNQGMVHHGAAVEIGTAGRTRVDLPLLTVLTWYVLVLYMQDAAAAAASG